MKTDVKHTLHLFLSLPIVRVAFLSIIHGFMEEIKLKRVQTTLIHILCIKKILGELLCGQNQQLQK